MGSAKAAFPVTDIRSMAPQFGGAPIVLNKIAIGVAGVDADRQPLKSPSPDRSEFCRAWEIAGVGANRP